MHNEDVIQFLEIFFVDIVQVTDLPEAYLEPSRISAMKYFCKKKLPSKSC